MFDFQFKETVKQSFKKVKEEIEEQRKIINKLKNETDELKSKFSLIIKKLHELEEIILSINKEIESKPESKKRDNELYYDEKRLFVFKKILTYLKLGIDELSEIKRMIVDKERICSKASFYRYIKELIKLERIAIISEGRSKKVILINI